MTWWDIKPQGVRGQLQATSTQAGNLEAALRALVGDVQAAGEAAGTAVPGSVSEAKVPGPWASGPSVTVKATGPVAAALAEYLQARGKDFASMANRVQAALLGAAKATQAYVEGDLETAREAQAAARSVRLDLLKGVGGEK
ncbi:DUF6507 family protein [Streptomyces sp. MRC013]|uniref:DUF6507 family protein n=1 Tax=Streptomyces sp. MRC013 TaxID=2898276 RepID=UPI00202690C3|nr:DUF6507 family protein [Streptomyces sp. MRC013]URM91585.1 DUF6507 family protein [Streptomyces sp. MRC013]